MHTRERERVLGCVGRYVSAHQGLVEPLSIQGLIFIMITRSYILITKYLPLHLRLILVNAHTGQNKFARRIEAMVLVLIQRHLETLLLILVPLNC